MILKLLPKDTMISSLFKHAFGTVNSRFLKSAYDTVARINTHELSTALMSDDELIAQTMHWKEKIANGMALDSLLVKAFAAVREVASRKLSMRHFDVQLVGGITLHNGMIAEMKTGEGKTLVATLAAYLNALDGKGVHVVTVNDYLADRDAEWMGEIYRALGLSVGCIKHHLNDTERQAAYDADITYGTSNELAFDYQRDNMKHTREAMVQRGLHYSIVDEADFIFIDEARTPLIISGETEKSTDAYSKCDAIIKMLEPSMYEVKENKSIALLLDGGIEAAEHHLRAFGLLSAGKHIYDVEHISLLHHLNQALRANTVYSRDKDYIVRDGKVIIIDEFTGRMMDGRRYSDGLHQAIEAKEHVEIKSENTILASITFQNYFRLYNKLSGMTGTASTEAAELHDIYNLAVKEIPANLPVKRIDEDDSIYLTEEAKLGAVVKAIKEARECGQPVLIGTSSIAKSEQLSELLTVNNLTPHNVLNAKYHENEAYIIAQAGMKGAITIATNMAGRGTDIKLGGNIDMMLKAYPELSREAIEAQIIQGHNEVIAAGGLLVIGTERHDSRRIDNQLRGRSGRQGDPGRSKFYISLEDDLIRGFGMEKMGGVLSKLGMQADESIEHPWVSRSIERAQQKVEARNYEIRKNLVKYDDAIDKQRKVIFEQRNRVIDSDQEIICTFDEIRRNVNARIVNEHVTLGINEGIANTLGSSFSSIYGITIEFDETQRNFTEYAMQTANKVTARLFEEKTEHCSSALIARVQKYIWLNTLDGLWREHLLMIDSIRQSVSLRAMGQKDPFSEFVMETFKLFNEMMSYMETAVIERFAMVEVTPVLQQKDDEDCEQID